MTKNLSRREFINALWALAATAALGESAFVGLRFLAPRPTEGEFGGMFNLGDPGQYPPGSVTLVEAGHFYLVHINQGGFIAVYRRCTHLGCSVPYDPGQKQFVCPCHGSAFTTEGDVLNAPAPRPLDLFAMTLSENGELLVNTGQTIERDQITPEHVLRV